MPEEAACLMTPCSSLPKSAHTQLSSAPVLRGMAEHYTLRPHWGKRVWRDNPSGSGCRDDKNRILPGFLEGWGGVGGGQHAESWAHTVAASCRGCTVTSGSICCAVNNVWRCRVRVQIFWLGKLFVGCLDLRQDASVSESLLPSVPGPVLSGNPDYTRHQLGMLL